MSKKLKVGHDFKVGPDINPDIITDIGGYKLVMDENMVLIAGRNIFNILASPINYASIMPMTKDMWSKETLIANPECIGNTFKLKKNTLYFQVGYGLRAWVFKELRHAEQLMSVLLSVKIDALLHKGDK